VNDLYNIYVVVISSDVEQNYIDYGMVVIKVNC